MSIRPVLRNLQEETENNDENIVIRSVVPHVQNMRQCIDHYEKTIINLDQELIKINDEIIKAKEWLNHLYVVKDKNQHARQVRIDDLQGALQIIQGENKRDVPPSNTRR